VNKTLLLAGAVVLAGCAGSSSDINASKLEESGEPRVVVAVIDSAFNPYHEFFHEGSPIYKDAPPSSVTPEILAAFGITDDRIIEVTRTGNFSKDIKADEALWASVRPARAYWFKGTNVIGISHNTTPPLKPTVEKNPHGVGTTSRVLAANPEAIVVFVENFGAAESETFAMTHPSIDIITTSYGPVGSVPLPGHITDSFTGVYGLGKLHFGAADNTPAVAAGDSTAGPWWSIGIGGLEEGSSDGRQGLSGNLVDFLGDFTSDMPYCTACERGYEPASGTSFATPTSAGVASKILLEARRALGHGGGIQVTAGAPPAMVAAGGRTITNWELRRALEEGAWVPAFDDYDPAVGVPEIAYPVPPAAPWTVVGWGVISPDPARGVVQQTLAHLGIGAAATRVKETGYCDHQTALIQARKVYWDTVNVGSQTFGAAPTPDPFVYCAGLVP